MIEIGNLDAWIVSETQKARLYLLNRFGVDFLVSHLSVSDNEQDVVTTLLLYDADRLVDQRRKGRRARKHNARNQLIVPNGEKEDTTRRIPLQDLFKSMARLRVRHEGKYRLVSCGTIAKAVGRDLVLEVATNKIIPYYRHQKVKESFQ